MKLINIAARSDNNTNTTPSHEMWRGIVMAMGSGEGAGRQQFAGSLRLVIKFMRCRLHLIQSHPPVGIPAPPYYGNYIGARHISIKAPTSCCCPCFPLIFGPAPLQLRPRPHPRATPDF